MITLKSAGRLRPRAIPLMAAALLLVSVAVDAQQRSRPSGSSSSGRSAHGVGSRSSGGPSPSHSPSAGGSSGQSRTAHPSDGGSGGGPQRQRPHNPDNDGHHHGHGGYYGGGYYGGYNPYYYGYGYWPSFWWGWGWYGAPYYPQPYYGGYSYYGEGDGAGALDLDVAPGRTQVYLDGQYIGTVDAFDGWPRYLWLRKGTYDLVFYLDGYKTLARQITVYPGSVIDVGDRMEPGESTRPEDLISKSTERRDERLRYERQRREEVEHERQSAESEEWQDRIRRDRGRDEGEEDGRDSSRHEGGMEESGRRGHLLLTVYPQDASIYLDGRFVGTGTELSLMRSGLPVSPGDHELSIVRPGRKAEEREFTVQAGEEVELEVELESESR